MFKVCDPEAVEVWRRVAILEGPAVTGRAEPDGLRIRRAVAGAGPGAADVLRALVLGSSTLLDAPARLAMLRAGRLEWVLAQDDDGLVAGTPVATNNSPCGHAWNDGEARLLGDDGRPAPCLGSPPAALVVPVVLPAVGGGRRTSGRPEVCALLALTGSRTGWFDEGDLATCTDLAAVAAARLAELVAKQPAVRPVPEPAAVVITLPDTTGEIDPVDQGGSAFGGWFTPDADEGAAESGRAVPPPPTRPVPRLLPPHAQPHAPLELETVQQVPAQRSAPATPRPPLPTALPAAESMGLWQWDARTGECTWSSPVARLLGLPLKSGLDLELVRQVIDEVDRPRFDIAVRAVTSGRGVAGALRLTGKDGKARHAYAWSEVRRAPDGELLGAWGGVVDVTTFRRDASAERNAMAGLRAAQELAGLATWEWHPATGELVWSDEMYRLIGVSPDDVTPSLDYWHSFVHPDDLARARRLDSDAQQYAQQYGQQDGQHDVAGHAGLEGERVETFRLIGPGGAIRHVQSWAAIGPAEGSGPTAVFGATIDVTRQVQDRISLERLSSTDSVTGLANRAAFDRRVEELLARPGPPVTLILLDLDRFKVVNDGLGHQVGDRLLIEVARRLAAVVPDSSFVARMGGDEFVVLPPAGLSEGDAIQLAERIVEALRTPYVLPETGEILLCPASLGISRNDRRRVGGLELLREADIALYRAKDSGRDRYVIFDEGLREATAVRMRAERRLRSALENDLLMVQFQPVVDFVNGRIVGAEAMVRLRDPDAAPGDGREDRLLPPEIFLDVAERTGLVVEIDAWVVEQAIAQITRWGENSGEAGESPWLSVNVSARSLEHPGVTRRLLDAVQRGRLGRDRIRIEVGEHGVVGTVPGVEAALRQLITAGIKVGIDGFGSGYSAVSYLQQMDPAFVKIAPSFVAQVGENHRADAVVTAIVELAHAYGMQVVAEGVESGRQARRLRELGCDLAQGYHFGRPGEASRIVRS